MPDEKNYKLISMNSLEERIESAVQLRMAEKHEEARAALLQLYSEYPDDAQVNLQCAWIHDLLGLERTAIPFYEKAVGAGLHGEDLQNALLGMGSTYRCIGEYHKAKNTFEQALKHFPDHHEFEVFLAMTLYNLNDHNKAMEMLLTSLLDTTKDQGILAYERALRFYADKLDETW